MSWKESRIRSVLTNRCPKCHQGKVFKHNTIFHPKKFDKMYERCNKCGHKYELETGFFYGAMYASYATTVAFSVAVFVLVYLIYPPTPYWVHIINILTILIVFAPLNFRLGRLVWMNLFTGFDPEAIKQHQQRNNGSSQTS
ncbi:MAG TPA: DUF983 domain-containing protein [Brumimicrobium sp.]|nr:DUF983 domain-containing protein [Brumimicrobium sp.]